MKALGAAFFDVDGTILRGNIVEYYARLRQLRMSSFARGLWTAWFVLRIPFYVALDLFSRRWFARVLYRNYRKLTVSELNQGLPGLFEFYIEPRIFPEAVLQISKHRSEGYDVVLVSGSIAPIVRGIAERVGATEFICCHLQEKEGHFTGELQDGPMTDQEKARVVKQYIEERGLEAAHCFGYADSLDDIPMLECVGHPKVVNPDRRMLVQAERRGWDILEWKEAE